MNELREKLPPEIGDVFNELDQHISWLHANWFIFAQLFATTQERVELLNEFAPVFFRLCQDSFSDNIILAISRLTDRSKSAGKDTLSLEQLVTRVDPDKYPDLRTTLDNQLASLKTCCQSVRDVRNRRLAHNDLRIALKFDPNPLSEIVKDDVEKILQAIRKLMDTVWAHFVPDSELGFDVLIPNDGEAIIAALEKAKKYREITQRRKQNV